MLTLVSDATMMDTRIEQIILHNIINEFGQKLVCGDMQSFHWC